jgi:SET domain-containing protein
MKHRWYLRRNQAATPWMCLAGIIVRRVHADRLEDSYEKAGKDHYLFAVDQSEFIVDATNQGGMARFVNHSCGCVSNNPRNH